jgi:ParB-like chromosome segregation protein Spo0J
LNQIQRDIKFSPRIEQGTVKEIAEDYANCFDQLPPIVVFKVPDRDKYILVDGWHRYRAAEILKLEEVEVDKKTGSLEEAKEHALLSNLKHGLPLTRKEKRHVIEEFLKLYPGRSNSWIAGDLGTTHPTVSNIRKELEAGCKINTLEILIGKDGKEYPRTIEQPKQEKEEDKIVKEEVIEEKGQSSESKVSIIPMLGIYQLNKAHQVNCIEGLAGLPENSLDLVFAA